jgi:hypothetical protein
VIFSLYPTARNKIVAFNQHEGAQREEKKKKRRKEEKKKKKK